MWVWLPLIDWIYLKCGPHLWIPNVDLLRLIFHLSEKLLLVIGPDSTDVYQVNGHSLALVSAEQGHYLMVRAWFVRQKLNYMT